MKIINITEFKTNQNITGQQEKTIAKYLDKQTKLAQNPQEIYTMEEAEIHTANFWLLDTDKDIIYTPIKLQRRFGGSETMFRAFTDVGGSYLARVTFTKIDTDED